MTESSRICNFIKDNPNDWMKKLSEKDITVKTDNGLAIFNYGITSDFSDPVVQEARGIIIDTNELEVVCWPFRKFGNYSEGYADEIDWATARVQEKIDGSIVKLWWDKRDNCWTWSTNSMIHADDARSSCGTSFMQLILSARNHKRIPWGELDRDYTYIFELVSPYHQIVVRYPYTELWHIGTRNNKTGKEVRAYLGIQQPEEYSINSLDGCINAAKRLGTDKDGSVIEEGFVVVDAYWNRVKVKNPAYFAIHRIATSRSLSKKHAVELLRSGEDYSEYTKRSLAMLACFSWYQWQYAELQLTVEEKITLARVVFEEMSRDRKAFALWVQENDKKWASFMFKAIGNDRSASDILASCSNSTIESLIENYKWESK